MSKRSLATLCIVLSTVLYGGVFLVPFLPLRTGVKWYAGAGLYGASWLFFFAAIGLVGREGYEAMKSRLMARFRRAPWAVPAAEEPEPVTETDGGGHPGAAPR